MFEDALIAWDDEDDPRGNVRHIDDNGISMEDFEAVLIVDNSRVVGVGRVAATRPGVPCRMGVRSPSCTSSSWSTAASSSDPSRLVKLRTDVMALERIRARPRTPEEIAEEEQVRATFRDRPNLESLIARGEIDPERIMTLAAEESLLKGLIALKRARQDRGLSLSEISRRWGIDLASLSRLETGKNPNPTFETLSRYAHALGLRLELSSMESSVPVAGPSD